MEAAAWTARHCSRTEIEGGTALDVPASIAAVLLHVFIGSTMPACGRLGYDVLAIRPQDVSDTGNALTEASAVENDATITLNPHDGSFDSLMGDGPGAMLS